MDDPLVDTDISRDIPEALERWQSFKSAFLDCMWIYKDKTNVRADEQFWPDILAKLPKWVPLPAWPVDSEVDEQTHLRRCCNGARKWAWVGLARMASIYIIFPIFACFLSDCKQEHMITANIVGNDWPLCLGFWIIYLPSAYVLNQKALSYFLKVQVKGKDAWGGTSLPPCVFNLINKCIPDRWIPAAKKWCITLTLFSIFARQFAYMWNAEVMGMLLKPLYYKDECKEIENHGKLGYGIDVLWAAVVRESKILDLVYTFTVDQLGFQRTFASFLLPVYVLCSLQLFLAIAAGYRLTQPDKVRGNAGDRRDKMTQPLCYTTPYARSGTNDMTAFMLKADMACMDACVDHQNFWVHSQLDKILQQGQWRVEVMHDYLHLIVSQMERIAFRFALVGLCQNVATANVQASLFAAMYRMQGVKGSCDKDGLNCKEEYKMWPINMPPLFTEPVFLNMVLCFLGTIPAFIDGFAFRDIQKYLQEKGFKQALDDEIGTDIDVQRLRRRVSALNRRFYFYAFIYLAVTLWTISKLVMIGRCTDTGLYNFQFANLRGIGITTTWDDVFKCVEKEDLHKIWLKMHQ